MQDFTSISAKAVAAGNLTKQEKGRWFMRGLPIEYSRHAIERTGAVVDKPSTFVFERLKEAVESRIVATENAERMAVLLEEDVLNVQLIQELRQQRNRLDRQREGGLLDPARLGVHGGALMQQQSPTDQATAHSPALGYEDWQNSTRPPQDSQYPQGSQYPQDFTAFGRPQWDAQGQQGTQRQGWQTCFGCGGHRFTEFECQGLKDLVQQGFVHLSDQERLAAGTRDQPGPELPLLGNKGQLKGIKNWLRTYQGTNPDRPRKEQTQQPAFHDGVVLKNSDKMRTNWEDCYQVRPTDLVVTPSQQRPQTRPTLRDSRTARTIVKPQAPQQAPQQVPQAPPQKNVRSGDSIQIRSRPADETAKAWKKNKSFDPWRRSWRRTLNQVSH
ncbi:uncharacterized protein K441DRAFT_8929 [Cenococcum geophilum 1.58]|uniref:uncharacterized protein n=1 Tax=Cenococcum geophilum 1.58 TaxID=794803 RepID=UPI00358FDDDC|nr:hypothetical protein K441DRAFT_8929 [Cenococcum geophilum 1.58]